MREDHDRLAFLAEAQIRSVDVQREAVVVEMTLHAEEAVGEVPGHQQRLRAVRTDGRGIGQRVLELLLDGLGQRLRRLGVVNAQKLIDELMRTVGNAFTTVDARRGDQVRRSVALAREPIVGGELEEMLIGDHVSREIRLAGCRPAC